MACLTIALLPFPQVVDALFDRVPALADWKLLVSWLAMDKVCLKPA